MRNVFIAALVLILMSGCGGNADRSVVVVDPPPPPQTCSGYVTGTVVDTLNATSVADRTYVVLQAATVWPVTIPNTTDYRPIAGTMPDAAGKFSLCIPLNYATADLLIAMASTPIAPNTFTETTQYGPTVVAHVRAGDIGKVPVAGNLTGAPVSAPVLLTVLGGGVTGSNLQQFDLWIRESITDPADPTRLIGFAVPELYTPFPTPTSPGQVLGANAPIIEPVSSLAPWVRTTVQSFPGGPQEGYSASATPLAFSVVVLPRGCSMTSATWVVKDTDGLPMLANPGKTDYFGQATLKTC